MALWDASYRTLEARMMSADIIVVLCGNSGLADEGGSLPCGRGYSSPEGFELVVRTERRFRIAWKAYLAELGVM